jgi:hypothetical protein
MEKYKLLAFANFKGFKKFSKEEGPYVLVVPYGVIKEKQEALWGHFCTNSSYAMKDLQYPNRKKFLDEYFGEGNWEIELYEFTTLEEFKSYCEKIAVECDLDKLEKQLKDYKDNDIHL